jgi:hypothetical protein
MKKIIIRILLTIMGLCLPFSLAAQTLPTPNFAEITFSFSPLLSVGEDANGDGESDVIGDDKIHRIGLDNSAGTDVSAGLDSFDDIAQPSTVPGLGIAVFDADIPRTSLFSDVRPVAPSVTWKLIVDIGNKSSVTIHWLLGPNPNVTFPGNYGIRLKSFPNGSTLDIDMETVTSHTITKNTTLLVVMNEDTVSNSTPVAVSDSVIAFSTETFPLEIDVLSNDFDADGDDLKITAAQSSTGATVAAVPADTVNNKINYSPVNNAITSDTFTYTISDTLGATAIGTASVILFNGDIIATRDHPSIAKAGSADADSGLPVDIEIRINAAVTSTIDSLQLIETVPIFATSTGAEIYSLTKDAGGDPIIDVDDGGAGGVVTATGNETTQVTFTVDLTTFDLDLPIRFSYRLIGPLLDRGSKTLTGVVDYDLSGVSQTVVNVRDKDIPTQAFTTFTAVGELFHSADYRTDPFAIFPFDGADGFIDGGELSRVVNFFRLGYHNVAPSADNPDGFATGNQGVPTIPHSADYRTDPFSIFPFDGPDGFLDGGELSRVVNYFRKGYNIVPKSVTNPDGFDAKP